MDKKSKETIKELLHNHLELYKNYYDYSFNKTIVYLKKKYDLDYDDKKELVELRQDLKEESENLLFKLNNLLSYEDRIKEVVDLEQEIKKIQAKKYISVKEFTEIYGYSSDWQKNRRSRVNDRLPFRQEGHKKKIMYVVEDVEIWFQNNSI